jgi:hypothetical protein
MTLYLSPVTPCELTRALRALCVELAPDGVPAYVDVVPASTAVRNECFANVKKQVADSGGSVQFGWALWEMPTLFVEAEFHANWRRPDGGLVDITPKKNDDARTFFLADPVRVYEGRQVMNERRAMRHVPSLAAFLQTFDDLFELLNRGERDREHGTVQLDLAEQKELKAINLRQAEAQVALLPWWPHVTPYSPCPCGSGLQTKRCHRGAARAG